MQTRRSLQDSQDSEEAISRILFMSENSPDYLEKSGNRQFDFCFSLVIIWRMPKYLLRTLLGGALLGYGVYAYSKDRMGERGTPSPSQRTIGVSSAPISAAEKKEIQVTRRPDVSPPLDETSENWVDGGDGGDGRNGGDIGDGVEGWSGGIPRQVPRRLVITRNAKEN